MTGYGTPSGAATHAPSAPEPAPHPFLKYLAVPNEKVNNLKKLQVEVAIVEKLPLVVVQLLLVPLLVL